MLLALAGIGVGAYLMYDTGTETDTDKIMTGVNKNKARANYRNNTTLHTYQKRLDLEQRESNHSGLLISANRSANAISSEETKIVRPTNSSKIPVMQNLLEWQNWFYGKNFILGNLYADAKKSMDNNQIIRPNLVHKTRLMMLPNHEAYSDFDSLPNAYYDRQSADTPVDNMILEYRDQYGNAGGAPAQGYSYLYPSFLYYGNPWGVGGQNFVAVGNEHRKPNYETNRVKTPGTAQDKLKNPLKKVRFGNNVNANKQYKK